MDSDVLVPATASPFLERIVSVLGASRVEVRYPGAWLSDRVWATHGHYLDRHLMPVSTWGVLRGGRRLASIGHASPLDYERSGRIHVSPAMRWLPRPLAAALEDVADVVRAATMPSVQRRVLHPAIAPLIARMLSMQVRRHSIPALARVVSHLGIEADHVIFGHVHRLGPLPGDALDQWQPPGGPAFLNTGSWLYEPLLVHRAHPPHPYWPGGAVVLEDGANPKAIGLLNGLTAGQLH